MTPLVLTLLLGTTLVDDAAASPERVRVFFARIEAGQGTTTEEVSLIQNAVLVAARERAAGFDVVGASDVAGLLQAESEAQAAGCDTVECASELADALNAPQLVTGELGRVGDTWLLTLTRIDRGTLAVIARQQVSARGDAPDVLLGRIPRGVGLLFGEAPGISPLVYAGGVGMGLGVVGLVVGGILHGLSWNEHAAATAAAAAGDAQTLSDAKGRGEAFVVASVIGYAVGGVLLVAGGATLGAGLMGVGE